jgi:hypothetical protein
MAFRGSAMKSLAFGIRVVVVNIEKLFCQNWQLTAI